MFNSQLKLFVFISSIAFLFLFQGLTYNDKDTKHNRITTPTSSSLLCTSIGSGFEADVGLGVVLGSSFLGGAGSSWLGFFTKGSSPEDKNTKQQQKQYKLTLLFSSSF